MKYLYCFCLVSGFLFLSVPVWAQQEEEAKFKQLVQEFNFSLPVYPQDKKEVQLTSGNLLQRYTDECGIDLSFGFEYGITDRFQVDAAFSDFLISKYEFEGSKRNNYQLSAGMLYNVVNNKSFSSSLVMEFGIPVNEGVDNRALQYEPQLVVAKQIGKGQLHLHAGAEIQKKKQEYFNNIIFVYPVGGLKPLLELNASYEDQPEFFISPGLVWNNERNFEVVAGTTIGLWQQKKSWGIDLKLIYGFSFDK